MSRLMNKPDEATAFPRIVYIMGTGRSGTTILEILLSNNTGVSGVGEVTHIFQDAYLAKRDCSCGKSAPECTIWGQVKAACQWQDAQLDNYNRVFVDFAWHTRFLHVFTGLVSGRKKAEFKRLNDCLFRSVSELSASATIVDSSKYAGRALQLARMYPKNVRVICLTRAPAGLVSAFRRKDSGEQPPKPLFGILLYYIYTMTCFRLVKLVLGKRVLPVQFEQLSADPAGTLDRIEQWSGIDLSDARRIVAEQQILSAGHIVTGNRLRMRKDLTFKTAEARKFTGSIAARAVVFLMSVYKKILFF